MADQTTSGSLIDAARAIGSTIGKVVSTVTGAGDESRKHGLWAAEYIGSGTFIIHRPKRKPHKRRQSALRSPRPGMRK